MDIKMHGNAWLFDLTLYFSDSQHAFYSTRNQDYFKKKVQNGAWHIPLFNIPDNIYNYEWNIFCGLVNI